MRKQHFRIPVSTLAPINKRQMRTILPTKQNTSYSPTIPDTQLKNDRWQCMQSNRSSSSHTHSTKKQHVKYLDPLSPRPTEYPAAHAGEPLSQTQQESTCVEQLLKKINLAVQRQIPLCEPSISINGTRFLSMRLPLCRRRGPGCRALPRPNVHNRISQHLKREFFTTL